MLTFLSALLFHCLSNSPLFLHSPSTTLLFSLSLSPFLLIFYPLSLSVPPSQPSPFILRIGIFSFYFLIFSTESISIENIFKNQIRFFNFVELFFSPKFKKLNFKFFDKRRRSSKIILINFSFFYK